MTADGDEIGTIREVRGGKAHVEPAGSLTSSIRQRLGWTDESKDTFEMLPDSVANYTADAVHLEE